MCETIKSSNKYKMLKIETIKKQVKGFFKKGKLNVGTPKLDLDKEERAKKRLAKEEADKELAKKVKEPLFKGSLLLLWFFLVREYWREIIFAIFR